MVSRYELFSSAISSIYHDIQRIERTEMARFGLKGPHAQCLVALNRYPEGITAARLCEVCEKDKAAVSRIIAELEEEGMVTRDSQGGSRYRAGRRPGSTADRGSGGEAGQQGHRGAGAGAFLQYYDKGGGKSARHLQGWTEERLIENME